MTASQSHSQVAVKHKEPNREMGPHDLSILMSEQVLPDHRSVGLVTGSKRRWPIQSVRKSMFPQKGEILLNVFSHNHHSKLEDLS